jgi:P-type Ca2+ transporter type 2C
VVYVPVLQQAFGTVGLSGADWLRCIVIASSVLWLREIGKLVGQLRR